MTSSSSKGTSYNNHCWAIAPNEECGSIAITNPLTGYEPNLFGIPGDFEDLDSIFRGANLTQFSNYDLDKIGPATGEIDDFHTRNAIAAPLFT